MSVVVANSIMAAGKKGIMDIFYGCIFMVVGIRIHHRYHLVSISSLRQKCKIKRISFTVLGAKTVKEKRISPDFSSYAVVPGDRNS